MNLQEELKALNEIVAGYDVLKQRISELEYHARKEQEFPQDGDGYWYIGLFGAILRGNWAGDAGGTHLLTVGNIFKTDQEAVFALEKLKVEVELRKYSRPFIEEEDNHFMVFDTSDESIDIWSMSYSKAQGIIHFESKAKAQQAIESVGEERVKKYIFGVEAE